MRDYLIASGAAENQSERANRGSKGMNERLGLQNERGGGRTGTQIRDTYKYIYNSLKCHSEFIFVVLSD